MNMGAFSPELSVIMGVFNGEEYIEEAVLSILNQTFANFELIIVDNASTDATVQKICSIPDPRIRLIRNERNMERAYSRNVAVQQASAPLIAVMDADDYAIPYRLEVQVAFMRRHPEIAVCAGFMEIYETGKMISFPLHDDEIRVHLLWHSCLPHPTWMSRREAILKAGGYDHDFIPAEDYELLAKLLGDSQVRFACLPEVLVRYRAYPEKDRKAYEATQQRSAARVRSRLIRCLIPDMTEEEQACHDLLCGENRTADTHALVMCRAWLKRLLIANEAMEIYSREVFRDFWLRRWWNICAGSMRIGTLWELVSVRGLQGSLRCGLLRPMSLVFWHWLQRKLLPSKWRLKNIYRRELR